jgi:hypothetical protein
MRGVEARLRSLPPTDRAAELLEVRQHLEALAQARQEAGVSEEDAWCEALSQFGDAATVGNDLCHAWRKRNRAGERRLFVGATASVLVGIFGIGLLQWAALRVLNGTSAVTWAIAGVNLVGPLVVGFMTGALVPRKAIQAVLTWCVVVVVVTLALMWLYGSRAMPDMRAQLPQMLTHHLLFMARWSALCLAGAWLGRHRPLARAEAAPQA